MENTTAAPDSTTPNAMDDAPLLFVQQPTMSSMALSPATSLAFDPSYQAQPLADPPVPTPQHHAQSLDAIIGQHRHLHRRHSSDASTYRTNSSAPHSRSGSFVEGSDATHTHSRCSTQSGQPLSARRHNPYTPVLSPHGPIGGNDPHTPSNRPPSRHLTTEGGLLNLSPHDIATRNSEHGTPSGPSTPAVLASVGFKDMHASSLSASSHSVTWHSRQPSLSAPPLAPPVAPPQYGDLYSGQAPPVPHPASFPWTHQHESNSSTLPPLPYGIPYHHHHHHHHHHHFHGFGPHPGPYGMGVSPMFQPHHHHRHYHQHMAFTHQHHFDPTAANVVVPPGESPAMTAPHTRRGKRGGRSKRGGAGYVGPDATHHKRTRRGCRAGQRVKEREAMGAAAAVGPEGQTIPADADDDGVSDTSSSSSNDDS